MKTKTLFENEFDDEFLKQFSRDKRPQTKQKLAQGYFKLQSAKEGKYFTYYFELHDHFIFCKKDPDSEELAYMDIANSFLKLTQSKSIEDENHKGIKFIKKKAYEELYSTNDALIGEWHEALKRYCVMTNFKQHYETIKVLGKGNFAKVFLVQRKSDKRQYAVKVFDKSVIMDNEEEKKCLLYEIKMMREVNFYRVLKMHELYEGEQYLYCLCELYPGTDLLKAIVKKGSQPEDKALTIMMQILEAVSYMHSKKIMHRDIKPENIIFRGSDNNIDIGIVDLGFATFEEDYKKLFSRCGTPGYVAPEILNDKDYDLKVDVFSVGVIMYMILSGSLPFKGSSYQQIVNKNAKGDVSYDFSVYNVKVSDNTMDLMKAMLEKDPSKRISAIDALKHPAFDNLMSKSPMVMRNNSNREALAMTLKLMEYKNLKSRDIGMSVVGKMPDRIEDMSPIPSPQYRKTYTTGTRSPIRDSRTGTNNEN